MAQQSLNRKIVHPLLLRQVEEEDEGEEEEEAYVPYGNIIKKDYIQPITVNWFTMVDWFICSCALMKRKSEN